MVVVLGLSFNVATIIVGIFSMLFSYFKARGLISIPTLPITALTEFLHADIKTNVHPLPVTCFLYLRYEGICVLVYIMSMLWSITEAVSSSSWPFQFKVLMLNVIICIVLLHLSNFCFSLSSVAGFSTIGARVPISAGHTPFLPAWRAMWFEYESW